jgi:hypothetical protein
MDEKKRQIIKEFTAFIVKKLGINSPFTLRLLSERTPELKTYAYYSPADGLVCVYIKNRGCADVLRSIGHEFIHHKQNQEGRLKQGESIPDIGGPIEDEANSIAGQLVKEFGYSSKVNIYEI